MITVQLLERTFMQLPVPPAINLTAKSYAWSVGGGPLHATLVGTGSVDDLWEALLWLRRPVLLWGSAGDLVWYGFIAEASLTLAGWTFAVSLDRMTNRIAVAYGLVLPGVASSGTRETTAWQSDADSTALYGTKELLVSVSAATTQGAEARRATELRNRAKPVPVPTPRPGGSTTELTLTCTGWYDTLGWTYYKQPAMESVETTEQARQIALAGGQFLNGVSVDAASGLYTSRYRDGDATALDELRDLLDMGTIWGRPLYASVTPSRWLRIYEESEPLLPGMIGGDLRVDTRGLLYNQANIRIDDETCPVGVWVHLEEDVFPFHANNALVGNPSPFFIVESEYDVAKRTLSYTSRNARTIRDIGRTQEG